MTRVWCGVDLGSTNVKVVAVAVDGSVVSRASCPTPREAEQEGVGSDADALLGLVEDLLLEACAGLRIAAVCVAGVGEDGVPVDTSGAPTTSVLPWFDPRRRDVLPEVLALAEADPASRRHGVELDAARTVTGWAWLRRHRPASLDAACGWVALTDYPALRWTGRAVMSDTLAARSGAWDLADRRWVAARTEPFLGQSIRMPPVVSAGEVVGLLHSPRLEAAGVLEAGAVVVAGGHDHPVAASVLDRQDPGAVLDSMGTAEVVVRTTAFGNEPAGCDLSPAVVGSGTTALTVVELDRNVRWARKNSPDVSRAIDDLLARRRDVDARQPPQFVLGVAGGEEPHWSGSDRATPEVLASAVVLACAEAGARAVAQVSGSRTDLAVYGAGGWTASPGWMRLKSRVLGQPYRVLAEPELTCLGAAQLALTACGHEPGQVGERAG